MPQEEDSAPIAEAKDNGEPTRAPLRLMTQFLRAVSESRMEDALALAQTILTFEPQNAIILDYQATLAQYVNNERDLASARDEDASSDDNGGDSSSGEEASLTSTSSDEVSTEEASGEESPEGDQETAAAAATSNGTARDAVAKTQEQELQRLGGVLRDLRETRVAESQEVASRWDEEKFAAPRREVEQVLWKFLPEEAKQAAHKRAQDDASDQGSRLRK